MFLIDLVCLVFLFLTLAFFETPVLIWTVVSAIVLGFITLYGHTPAILLLIYWVVFCCVVGFANFKKQRIHYFTKPVAKSLKKFMPTISRTEREAIDGGDVWWEKELFCGKPDWDHLHALPKPVLTQEEQAFLDNQVEKLCDMIDDWEVFKTSDLSKQTWDYLKQERFFSLVMPKEYGGLGFSAYACSSIVIKIASRSGSAAVTTMVPNSLGPAELLLHYGTEEQKSHHLPRLARCEEVPCFALTGAESGSDAGAMRDVGHVTKKIVDGKETIGITLNWDKRYITLAPVATLLGVAFYLYDDENLLGKGTDIGITLALISTDYPGVETGHRHYPLTMSFMNGPTRGKDVFIPLDFIIGGVNMVGQGWRMLMECLSIGRGISLPALATANARLIYRTTGAYTTIRKQFNTSIASFEGIEEGLITIAGLSYMIESCRTMSAGAVDMLVKPAIVSAITKYHTTELSRKIIDRAMDIHGGHAIQMGPRNILAAGHLAMPMSITVEGANILTRNLIIFGQGAIRCHPYILKEVELFAAEDSEAKFNTIDDTLMSHVGFALRNVARTILGGLTGGWIFCLASKDNLKWYYSQLTRMSAALAMLADMCMMILGGSLKRRENISARLGDILSNLYLASAVLKYYEDNGKKAEDLNHVTWCIQYCLYQIQVACQDILFNFPQPFLGKLLYAIIFPWGSAYCKPSDNAGKKLLESMLMQSPLRDRFGKNIYLPSDTTHIANRLERAFALRPAIEPLYKKLQQGQRLGKIKKHDLLEARMQQALDNNILTPSEVQMMTDFIALEQEIIKVNEFSADLSELIT